jgi:putative ABC transport system ATP-binding protein
MSKRALLETVDLKKTYRSGEVPVEALRGVSFTIESGQMVAVVGPSGCGKSSLMHILGAMARATSGHALIGGVDIADMDDATRTAFRRNRVGFVFQKFNLLPTITARANIELALQIHGSHKDPATRERLDRILDLLRLRDKLGRRPAELSGGEQQRVAIARAIAKNPAIVLADEPTGNLDSRNSELVLEMFRDLNRTLGQTIILVTHNPQLTAYTNRVIEMLDGKIVGDGAPSVRPAPRAGGDA